MVHWIAMPKLTNSLFSVCILLRTLLFGYSSLTITYQMKKSYRRRRDLRIFSETTEVLWSILWSGLCNSSISSKFYAVNIKNEFGSTVRDLKKNKRFRNIFLYAFSSNKFSTFFWRTWNDPHQFVSPLYKTGFLVFSSWGSSFDARKCVELSFGTVDVKRLFTQKRHYWMKCRCESGVASLFSFL